MRPWLNLWVWRIFVIGPTTLAFLLVAAIIPVIFLMLFPPHWLANNPVNSWILGLIIHLTTCFILKTSPTFARIAISLRTVDKRLRSSGKEEDDILPSTDHLPD